MIDDRGTVTNIHTFSGGFPGGPIGLMQRSDGRLYGTTVNGGDFDLGIVYAIDLDGTFRIVHSFAAGEGPALGIDLVETSDGNLYGVTHNGLFKIDSSDTLTMLQTASGQPPADLTVGIDERLYAPTAARSCRTVREPCADSIIRGLTARTTCVTMAPAAPLSA